MDAVLTSSPAQADISVSVQRFARALLHHAPPGHPDAGFFATVIGTSLAHHDLARSGLSPDEIADLTDHLFPGALQSEDARLAAFVEQYAVYAVHGRGDPQPGFTLLMRVLLEAYRAPDLGTTAWVTGVLAHACLRPDHLWRDLGLAGREDVTFLLARHYPGLVMRNTRNLRWKKFLAYSACEHAGLPPSAAPGCPQCEDHGICYSSAPD
ncbi:MAG: nitrogen fixation protein NifQ [Achromobacter sp.]|uniref:nitrogen fixation protein NifQ n=1 Tax=unclassified Achromobacter TaxID=2626865 RepID=UPI000E726229|nr:MULTISPECIES: nitrogen fixation protein NifQ [unclassified Achromobacter]AYD66343.1 nitrogen fixation protein NifQ [Achromobacter sp. B7]MDX3988138.1 nitrogen fixation protein NifQ [Achromobacter sp.]QYJ20582.1 nitrogen fixation protein NifQ [Achromobacter sp. ES-001]HCQ47766.1 nitrogen fixation protein NifQ [Achromobacter sp.]